MGRGAVYAGRTDRLSLSVTGDVLLHVFFVRLFQTVGPVLHIVLAVEYEDFHRHLLSGVELIELEPVG